MNLDRRLLNLARRSRLALVLTIGLGCAAGALTVWQASLLSQTINQVFLGGRGLEQVAGLLLLLLGAIGGRALLSWGSELASNAIAFQVKTGLRRQLLDHLLALGPAFTRGERSGELSSLAVEGIEALDAYYSQYLPQLALAALVPLIFLLLVFPLDLISGLVLLLTAPLIPLFMVLIGSLAQSLTRRQWQTLSRLSAYFLDVLQGLTTLKMLGRSQAQREVITQASERFRATTMGVLRVTFLSSLALEMVSTLSTAVVAVEVGLRLLYGRLSFEQAFFVLVLAPEFYLPLRLLGTRFHAGMTGVAAARRIFEVLDTPLPAAKPVSHRLASAAPHLEAAAIRFENVSYSYTDQRAALRGVSFEILPGQKAALVGPSGAGKSTIASLLLGFIQPQGGQILVSGQPVQELPPGAWRDSLAWVPQNPYLFNASLAENIRLARPQASHAQVVQAARLAHADDFIRALPQGYETLIGERGARLSGGQAQRVALARAFLKDAPFLILDEATANLDPENEALIQEALERLQQGRTVLMIAHRLNTVRRADTILVLEDGLCIGQGSHDQLLAQNDLYRRMVGSHFYLQPESVPSGEILGGAEGQSLIREAAPPAGPTIRSQVGEMHLLVRLLGFLTPFTGLVALSVLLGFLTIGSSMGLMGASAYILSMAALQPSIAVLQVPIVGVRFFGITRGLFRYLERYSSHEVTFRLLARLRAGFYQALEPLAPARLLFFQSGDLLARIMGDIESLENFYVRVAAPPLVACLVAGVSSYYLSRFDPRLAAALLACLLLAGVGVPWLARQLSRAPGRALVSRRAALQAELVDGIQGMADLLAAGQVARQQARMESSSLDLAHTQRRMASITALQTALVSLLANLGMWAVLVLAVPQVQAGRIAGPYLAVLALVALTSFEAVQPLPLAAQHLESSLEAARRLFGIVDAQPEVHDPPEPFPVPQQFDLQVRELRFRYPAGQSGLQEPYALDGISFSLPQGKRLAVVGPSGAGKSTLVNLLLRFWEYDQGQGGAGSIRLAGRELKAYLPGELRRQIAVVAQNTYLFSASVRENLLLARPSASQEELERAARQARIHDFICRLPQGYETWIGEQGLRLSAGERQRLAIARALLKDAPLLILDEATANLDALNEAQVMETIRGLMHGRSTLLITHRLVGMEGMDEILVLQAGRVVERGRHAELLSANGLYRRMWELQIGELVSLISSGGLAV